MKKKLNENQDFYKTGIYLCDKLVSKNKKRTKI